MLIRVVENCAGTCGVRVQGEIDTETQEFIHRFSFPRGSEALITSRSTEVDGVRLITFAPTSPRWAVSCPLCGVEIVVGKPNP